MHKTIHKQMSSTKFVLGIKLTKWAGAFNTVK